MKESRLITLLLTAIFVSGCGVNSQLSNTDNKSVNTNTDKLSEIKSPVYKLSKEDIASLDKEYMSFSTKSLSGAYFQKKLVQLIAGDNGVANAVKIVRELQYAQYKTETVIPFQAMSAADPSFYATLTGVAAVGVQRTGDSPFDVFIGNSNPITAPTAIAATSVSPSGFTANWNTTASATSGYVLTVKQGVTVVSTTPIVSQATTSQVITGLTASTAYTYTVQAKNGALLSSPSNPISQSTTSAAVNTGAVSTFAGSGAATAIDATGTNATFNRPRGIVLDTLGNLYVTDENNNKIRKITSGGVVTTFAGNGSVGAIDATGTNATFSNPNGIAIDSANNLYVCEYNNNKIRKITPGGAVTTLAGNGTASSIDNAIGTNATFNHPYALAVDSTNNVYVADTSSNKIRKITPGGAVTTFAGSGAATSTDDVIGTNASFNMPVGLAIDSSNNIFVVDQSSHKIRKIDNTVNHVVTTFAGSGSVGSIDATGTNATFYNPNGIAIDSSGNLYVSDTTTHKIRKITSAGVVTTIAGNGSSGSVDNAVGTNATFNYPTGIGVELSTGALYIGDLLNYKVRKIQ